jgi:sugar phosphate isomerase/epimerase
MMPTPSRREFFQRSAAVGFLAAAGRELRANPLGMPIGCQTYPVRQMIGQDFPGTIKQLADAGFQRIELCSPEGYASSGFGVIAKYKGPELRKILADLGVGCESCHFDMKELRENQAERIAWAKDAGITQMIVPSLNGPRTPTMDDVKRAADETTRWLSKRRRPGLCRDCTTRTSSWR